ncbi:hypothetical protein MWLp12_1551 [Lactiplantibacillus plantarum]|nr:hypothetical protein MWLp12_1551 [Lactiplantibacillus plantarum]
MKIRLKTRINQPATTAIVAGLVGWFLSSIMIVNLLGTRPMLNKMIF